MADNLPKWNWWHTVATSIVSIVATMLFGGIWVGGAMSRLAEVEQRTKQTDQKIDQKIGELQQKLDQIDEKVVDKDDFRELRNDVKTYLMKRRE